MNFKVGDMIGLGYSDTMLKYKVLSIDKNKEIVRIEGQAFKTNLHLHFSQMERFFLIEGNKNVRNNHPLTSIFK